MHKVLCVAPLIGNVGMVWSRLGRRLLSGWPQWNIRARSEFTVLIRDHCKLGSEGTSYRA